MSISSELSIEEFHQLILNASAYMTKIESFSFRISNASIQLTLECLTIASEILNDQTSPIIKKLYVLRFVKDTMILASLTFYSCVLITIFPWILNASKISENNNLEKRIEMMGKLLKGNQQLVNTDATVCKTILQLVEELIKWMGTNIRQHPYSKLAFRSAFRVVLERLPRIQNIRVTDLTFFKADDPNKFQAYYMERESGEGEGERIFEYTSELIRQTDKGKPMPQLLMLVETGDQHAIGGAIEELQLILEGAKPVNVLSMMPYIEQIHKVLSVGDVQAAHLIKHYLLIRVLTVLQILQRHKGQLKAGDQEINRIISMIKAWNSKCQSLLLPVQTFRQAYKLLEREGFEVNSVEEAKLDCKPQVGLTFEINKEKLNQIDCNESEAIKKIRTCKYIPVYESIPFAKKEKQKGKYDEINQQLSQNQQFLSSNRSNSKQSKVSDNSIYNKKQFLEAFSKFPQANLAKNTSEVNEIHLQHSNLSDQFHQINNLIELSKKPISSSQSSQKPLIMSFKKSDKQEEPHSPEVVFSDSFASNQKNSPFKFNNDKDFVDVINQPSMEVRPQHLRKESGSLKAPSSQNQNYSSNSFKQNSDAQRIEPEKAVLNFNDYMIPQKNGSIEYQPPSSQKSSHEGNKIKKEKSSSLARSNNRPLLKSLSRQKIVVSPGSKISNTKSKNILQFNEAEDPVQQRYKPEISAKNLPPPPVEQIKVEKTILKPKFGFKVEQQSILTQTQIHSKNNEIASNSLSKSKSLSSILSRPSESHTLGNVPDNFMDLLNVKPEKIRVNAFDNKVKELQKQIQRMKQKKEITAKVVMEKNLEIQKLKAEMPLPKEKLEQENKQLRRAMQPKKAEQHEVPYKLNQAFESKAIMKHISVTPLREDIKKQILYSKCRLHKGQYVQIGFQAKDNELSFYFTFLRAIEECNVKVEENSLKLTEEIDVKIYKLSEGKQIKFKSAIKGHQLYNGQFQVPNLIVKLQAQRNKSESIQLSVPFHLYNIIQFVSPKSNQKFAKIIDWHFCCSGILTNPHYFTDFFPAARVNGAMFMVRGELEHRFAQIRVIINNDKFTIEFGGIDENFQLMVVRCVMALLQKSSQ